MNLSDVERRRQIPVNGVEERLDTLVLVGGTTEHREDLRVHNHLTDGLVDLIAGEFLTGEVLLHECFVGLRDSLEELLVVLVGLVFQVGRDFLDGRLCADVDLAAPGDGVHVDQVNDAVEVIFSTDGELHDQRLCVQAVDDGVDGVIEVRAQLVHLVDEANAWDVVLRGLTPHLLGLRLDTFLTVEHGDGSVEDAK